jgi:hypothetical protein
VQRKAQWDRVVDAMWVRAWLAALIRFFLPLAPPEVRAPAVESEEVEAVRVRMGGDFNMSWASATAILQA